jgi:uncharacterized protein (TIGR03437 family)
MFLRTLVFLALAIGAYAQSATFQWIRQIGGSQGQSVVGLATDSDGNVYIAGSTGSVDFPTQAAFQAHPGGSGLYRMDAPGAPWQNLYNSGLTSVAALAVDPRNANTLYAAGTQGLLRTTDAGATWSALGSFDVQVDTVAVDPSASNVLYAGTFGEGIYKSTDSGASWTAINNGISAGGNGILTVYKVWVDPAQPSVVLAATAPGLVRSTDGGITWQTIPQVLLNPGLADMAFDANTPGLIYLATGGSLLKSTDHGITWTGLAQPSQDYEPDHILIDPRHPNTLYAAGLYGGFWVSADGGNTWTNPYPQYAISMGPLAADPASGAVYLVVGGNVFLSTNGFATATAVGTLSSATNSLVVAGGRLFAGVQASSDVFVTKFDPQGNTLYATYFGGTGTDEATAIAVDAAGSVYVTGTTSSVDFPVSPGAFAKSGSNFVFKLNPDGSLGYSTYFSPAGSTPYAIAVDGGGHAYIAGISYGNLPVTAGSYQTTLQGSYPCCNILGPGFPPVSNAFLAEFDAAGASLLFSTYIGSYTAYARVLALAPDGNAILAGAGSLYRMRGDGSALLNSGSLPGVVWALTVDGSGNIYAGGNNIASSFYTANSTPFPTTPGAFQTALNPVPALPGNLGNVSGEHGFVARLDSQFNIVASTLLGGESSDETLALAIGANGDVLAGGSTASKAFPMHGAAQGSFSASTGFVTELTPDLSTAVVSTYAGDTDTFNVGAIAPAADGGLVFAGTTASPPSYTGPFYNAPSGVFPAAGVQGFVVKVGHAAAAPRVDSAVNAASQLGVPLAPGGVFQVHGDGFGSDAVLLVNGNAIPLLSQSRTALTATLPTDFNAQAAPLVVQSGGGQSNPLLVPVASTAPGVYSVDGSGLGQGYILNQDGTLNSPTNPANEGAPITIFATGVGPLTFDGGFAVTASPVDVYIDGFYADGIAARFGPVAGLPGNVYQISVYVPRPSDYAAGNPNLQGFVMPSSVAVTLAINGATSQAGLALSVSH